MSRSSILIISDDPEFARGVSACWQVGRQLAEITVASSDVWHPSIASTYAMVIVGPLREGRAQPILSALEGAPGKAVVAIANDDKTSAKLQAGHPQVVFLPQQEGWTSTLTAICGEALRRVEALSRAQRAERLALESQSYATLGRYMLEMRPKINNALTSVLGNADLLLDPDPSRGDSREQIQTIHDMALRLNEIMQRFSSLVSEVRLNEKGSQVETQRSLAPLVERR